MGSNRCPVDSMGVNSMKKRWLHRMSGILLVMFALAGCGNNTSVSGDQSTVETTHPSENTAVVSSEVSEMDNRYTEAPTHSKEEIDRDFAEFLARIESLSADKVTTIRMEFHGGLTSSNHETNDEELIVQWIDLLRKMHFTVRSGPGPDGASAILYVLIDGDETRLGSFMGPDVIISNAAIGRIENYSEVEEEFEALEKAMMAL